jgi:hypothetical protein
MSERLSKLIDAQKELQRLQETPGWLRLGAMLQEQMDSLQMQIFQPLESRDAAFLQEYRKGEVQGRLALQSTLDGALSTLEYEISQLRRELENGRNSDQ